MSKKDITTSILFWQAGIFFFYDRVYF